MGNINIVTLVIIIANGLISYKGFNDITFFEKYKFHVGAIKSGEKIRLFSSGFLHIDFQHLIFNMLSLYFFAPVVISYLGNSGFVLIYVGSLLLGSFLSYKFHENENYYTAVGASGAVMGIIYAAILLRPEMSLYLFFIPIPIPAYIFGVGYLLYSIYGMKAKNDNIGHDAHFGGAIAGYVLTLILLPGLITTNITMVLLLAVPIVILFILKKTGKI